MDTATVTILSANVSGFRMNVGELTHSFVLKECADIVVVVETFLNESCVITCDRIHGYSHWARHDRRGGIAMCHRDGLHVDLLPVNTPDKLEIMFARLILIDGSSLLLCAAYRAQWQGSNPLVYLKDNLDDIMASHNCQNVVVVGDLNQHQMVRAFTELTVVQRLQNHVNFPTHQRGGSLDPVLTDLVGESVQCHSLDYVGTSNHLAILSTISLSPARDEEHHRTIWL